MPIAIHTILAMVASQFPFRGRAAGPRSTAHAAINAIGRMDRASGSPMRYGCNQAAGLLGSSQYTMSSSSFESSQPMGCMERLYHAHVGINQTVPYILVNLAARLIGMVGICGRKHGSADVPADRRGSPEADRIRGPRAGQPAADRARTARTVQGVAEHHQ